MSLQILFAKVKVHLVTANLFLHNVILLMSMHFQKVLVPAFICVDFVFKYKITDTKAMSFKTKHNHPGLLFWSDDP